MKVKVPVLIKDPEVSRYKDLPLVEDFVVEQEELFLDGPVSRRLAILDFDADVGGLRAGARFVPPGAGASVFGRYDVASRSELDADDFIQASTFGGVLKTLYLFEEPDTLGRAVRWAFDGSQLLVVPRAGEWGNAFYERESRSLQLFYVKPDSRHTIYACHSMDILAHETAHAVLDGIAPDLYDSLLPESLALHEAVADLTTLLMAFSSRKLAEHVLEQTGGSITTPSAFTEIAEQFGAAIHPGQEGLRDLFNDRTMKNVDTGEPHALSEVLSGALYRVMVRIHEQLKDESANQSKRASSLIVPAEVARWQQTAPESEASFQARRKLAGRNKATTKSAAAMRALWIAAQRFKRTVLRALDYLPPGEATFADYGRAIIASDQASHPDSGQQREWLKAEFVKRGIVGSKKELEVKTNYRHPAVAGLDLDELVRSDWLAYEFANRARSLLAIPPSIPFKVEPRLDVTKTYYHRARDRAVGAGVSVQGVVDRDRAERGGVGRHAPAAAPPRHDPGHRLGHAKRSRGGDDGEPHGRGPRQRAPGPRRDARASDRGRGAADRAGGLRARRQAAARLGAGGDRGRHAGSAGRGPDPARDAGSVTWTRCAYAPTTSGSATPSSSPCPTAIPPPARRPSVTSSSTSATSSARRVAPTRCSSPRSTPS